MKAMNVDELLAFKIKVEKLRKEGMSDVRISERLGIGRTTIQDRFKRISKLDRKNGN